jgi:hypothetical protein
MAHSVQAFYNPHAGTWINRDPIEEQGGANLYGIIRNDPQNRFDALGLVDGISPPLVGDWIYYPDSGNSRGGTWNDQNGRSASWDSKDSHWDVDDGQGNRQRYDRWGNPLTPDQAHSYRGPRQRPLRLPCGRVATVSAVALVLGSIGNMAQAANANMVDIKLKQGVETALKECKKKSAKTSGNAGCCGGCCQITIIYDWSSPGSFPNSFQIWLGKWWRGAGSFRPPSGYVTDAKAFGNYSASKCSDHSPVPSMIDPTTSTQEIIQIDLGNE